MAPRTIDNLGPEASQTYAERKEAFDDTLIKESQSPSLSTKTRIEVTTPSFTAELDTLLNSQPSGITWASLPPPRGYYEQRNKLFTTQLIPSIGSEERRESQMQKILTKIKSTTEQRTLKQKELKSKREQYEQERLLEEEENEKNVLTSLLEKITQFDKQIIEINSRRTQYQKG